jgi:hypothetical protein
MTELAPIALFVYDRPDHTLRTLEALANNTLAKESILYVFSDGPKAGASEDQKNLIAKVRKVIAERLWCKEVILKASDSNKGLASSIIEGVTEIVNEHGKIIVLEDDIITAPYFLKFLNDGLKIYQNVSNVYAVNAYMFPIDTEAAESFLSPLGTSTWGWATWAEKWKAFERVPVYKDVIQNNPHLRARFNLADYDYAGMLNNTNSWGIRWYYSVFMRNGLGVFTTKSLALNIGFSEQSTHTKSTIRQMDLYNGTIEVKPEASVNILMHEKILKQFANADKKKFSSKRAVKKLLKKILGQH